MKIISFIFSFLCFQVSFAYNGEAYILPSKYGISNKGVLISQSKLNAWLTACKLSNSAVYFPAGTYLLPVDFEYDFGKNDLAIIGDGACKTILTTNYGPASNFAVPEKIDLTRPRPVKEGIYQVDIIGANIHPDFFSISNSTLDSYIQVKNGTVRSVDFQTVKSLGYITALDATLADPGVDGLYVVTKHVLHEYGGGFKQLKLSYKGEPYYLQGTILQRTNGIWSRFYSSVAFIAQGNISVKDISFDNFRPYLFLPASKKMNQPIEIRDHFSIYNCSFNQVSRVLATMTYAGIDETPNWYKASSYYPIDQSMSFRNFNIANSAFSYIHESIVWGAPPCYNYNVRNNFIHDCYSMINCFYLFPQFNTALPPVSNSFFSVTGNRFLRIRVLNPGSENTVHLVRTVNKGIIEKNSFIDCTGIQLYLGGATIVRNNTIKTFMFSLPERQTRPPVILVKSSRKEMICIYRNDVAMGMMGNFIASESQASFTVNDNKLKGAGTRYISSLTDKNISLDIYRTYTIADMDRFRMLASKDNFDPAIQVAKTVYYNKRTSRWEALTVVPFMYLFSEVDHFNKLNQTLQFSYNDIEASYLTRIQKKRFTNFKQVLFDHNNIQYTVGLNAGNDSTIIENYTCTNNSIRNGSLTVTSLGNVSAGIKDLNISYNNFYVDFLNANYFTAAANLTINENIFKVNDEFNFNSEKVYPAFGLTTVAANVYVIRLQGAPQQQMQVNGNKFTAQMTRGNILNIIDPFNASITNNVFDMAMPVWQANAFQHRNAIQIDARQEANDITVMNNLFEPDPGKENTLLSFDNGESVIASFTNKNNKISSNESAISNTVSAKQKSFRHYYKGKNKFSDKETIRNVDRKIIIPGP